MSKPIKYSIWIFILSMTMGFRLLTGRWQISAEEPTIWIKVCSGSNTTVGENDITWNDPLAGISNLTLDQVIQSVIDDYNSIPTSFMRLAKYPADPANPGTPLAGDSVFTEEKAKTRTIEICFGATDARVTSGGYAKPTVSGKNITACELRAKESFLNKASLLTHLIVHELGHCFGLNHPQEGSNSVMSYFTKGNENKTRLKDDDKAGITHLYPKDSTYGAETPTYGMSGCEPKN